MITSSSAALGILALFLLQFGGTPLWVILIIILIIILLLWWGLSRNKIQETSQSTPTVEKDEPSSEAAMPVLAMIESEPMPSEPEPMAQVASVEAEVEMESMEPETADEIAIMLEEQENEEVIIEPEVEEALEPDNLQLIEGIGPKIAGILAYAGITTFEQLADTDVGTLEKIVREDAGIRIANPSSWPEQAALAAVGDWVGLEKLQTQLIGGRHA